MILRVLRRQSGRAAGSPVPPGEGPVIALVAGLGVAYDADRHPDFANIYEHRRNTAAVISGFKNLDDAVSRMGSAIRGSISSLGETMSASNASVSKSMGHLSGSLESASAQQVAQMGALNATAKRVHDEVFYSGHGRLPLM